MNLYELLPILMISSKKVNENKVNYEEYLIELLNNAHTFLRAINSDRFELIDEQAHGECDAKSNNYQIDFKLLVPTEFMYYKNLALPNVNYKHMNEGLISVNDTKGSLDKSLQTQANNAFANYIANICIANKDKLIKMQSSENILTTSIKNMLVNKNILAFIPCIFNDDLNSVAIIKKLFIPLLNLRDDIKKDTFITYLQGDYFYILKYLNNNVILVDKVHKNMVQTFMDLYRLTYFI